jgi:hypothetical protein
VRASSKAGAAAVVAPESEDAVAAEIPDLAVTFATEHRLVAVVADAITLQFAGIVQVFLPSLFVMSVPPLVAQSFPSTAMVILRLFDLLALLAADWPWAVSANAASAITAADTMCESFMMSPVKNQRLVYQNPMQRAQS